MQQLLQNSPNPPIALQVPKEISDQLDAAKDNDDAIKKLGIELGTNMCKKLLDSGVPGLHMYTLNLDRSALAILENLGLIRGRVCHFPLLQNFLKTLVCDQSTIRKMRKSAHSMQILRQVYGAFAFLRKTFDLAFNLARSFLQMELCACVYIHISLQVEQPLPWRAPPIHKRSSETVSDSSHATVASFLKELIP